MLLKTVSMTMLLQLNRMPILHRNGKKKPKMNKRNQTILKMCTMKLNLVLQLLHRQLNRITNRKQLLPNLLMMKRPRELLKKNLKNLLANKHPKKVPMTTNPYRSPTYREAILTDGILVDDIFKAIDQLAETGECDLGTIIYHCESMRYAG